MAVGSGDAVHEVMDQLAATIGGEEGLDSFFVVVVIRGQTVGCEVVVVKGYGVEDGELGGEEWEVARERAVVKEQGGEGH